MEIEIKIKVNYQKKWVSLGNYLERLLWSEGKMKI